MFRVSFEVRGERRCDLSSKSAYEVPSAGDAVVFLGQRYRVLARQWSYQQDFEWGTWVLIQLEELPHFP